MQVVAPAGSPSGLRAAVNAGADAVYLGLPLFGARAKAENFSLESLKDNIDFAHLFGTKVFITLNTLIKDSEIPQAVEFAKQAYDNGADAAIVQDIRFIKALKRELPCLPLHASTQMGIHNREGALALLDMGIRRAVLSRETLTEDITDIKRTGIEIEFFVQGALCVSFSGNCYFSSIASSYSGNRGKCMQLCRKPYIFNGTRGYHLSAKDIFLYDKLRRLEELGVDAIKIEGRMRSDEYVAQAVRIYKSDMSTDQAKEALSSVFNRGNYCHAYLDDNAPFNVIYSKSQANIGKFIGKLAGVSGKKLYINGFFANKGDGYKLMRCGTEIGGASERDGEIVADTVCKPGDELYRTFDGALSEKLKTLKRSIELDCDVELCPGRAPEVDLHAGALSVHIVGDNIAQAAMSRGITCNDVARAFEKVSDKPFEPHVNAHIDGDVFMPISELNAFRRKAYDEFYNSLAEKNSPQRHTQQEFKLDYNKFKGRGAILMVECAEQLSPEITSMVDYIAINPRDYSDFTIPGTDKPVLLNLPVTMRDNDRDVIVRAINRKGVAGVISNNYYTLKITDKPILLGPGHNIIGECELPHITSFESDTTGNGFLYAFGYAPLMTLCHCPYGKCVKCSGRDTLTDENGRKFILRRYKTAHCYWQLLNCVPHNMIINAKTPNKNMFFDCTELTARDILKLLKGEYMCGAYTRGNMNKGLK